MGHATNLYGIISFLSNGPNKEKIWNRNIEAISKLPINDDQFPWLSSKMFNKEFQPGWDERHISFAANYKNLELELDTWVKKFEDLLSQMMWISVITHIDTEVSGSFEIQWLIDSKLSSEWKQNEWLPTTKWETKGLKSRSSYWNTEDNLS